MSTPPAKTAPAPPPAADDKAMAREFLDKEYERALGIFKAAVIEIKRTATSNPKIMNGKKKLYAAETLAEFRAAAELFRGTTTRNPRISEAKRLLFKAAAICAEAEDGVGLHFDAQKPAPEAAPAPPAPADVARAKLSAPAALSPLDKTHRVVLSAQPQPKPQAAVAAAAGAAASCVVVMSAAMRNSVSFFNSFCINPARPAEPDAGKKRPAPDVICISSDDDEPGAAGGVAKSSKPVKAPKRDADAKAGPAKVVYAADFDGSWQQAVCEVMSKLKRRGIYDFSYMSGDAEDELRTLPEPIALECLREFLDKENEIDDPNDFLIDNAQRLRAVHGIEPPCSIYEQLMDEQPADDATESDEEAGAP